MEAAVALEGCRKLKGGWAEAAGERGRDTLLWASYVLLGNTAFFLRAANLGGCKSGAAGAVLSLAFCAASVNTRQAEREGAPSGPGREFQSEETGVPAWELVSAVMPSANLQKAPGRCLLRP